jgi:hypothetical protein
MGVPISEQHREVFYRKRQRWLGTKAQISETSFLPMLLCDLNYARYFRAVDVKCIPKPLSLGLTRPLLPRI